MDLDALRRLDDTLRDDFTRLQDAHTHRTAGFDDEVLDTETHVARWSKGGAPLWEGRLELVARYSPELGVFRWWWTAQAPAASSHPARLDRAYAEAQTRQLSAMLSRQIVLDDAAEAEMLSRVAAHLARAHGLVARAHGGNIEYYALFESATSLERAMTEPRKPSSPAGGGKQYALSMPPPAVAPRTSQPPPQARHVAPHEPALELVFPVAQAAAATIKRALGGAFQSAIVVIVIDTSREKARFYVQLVAVSSFGELEAPDTSKELLDAVTAMIVGDARSGNARWHKLVVRFFPDGQSLGMGKVEVF